MLKAQLIGNLGQDADVKRTSGNYDVCTFSVAHSDKRANTTTWVRCSLFGDRGTKLSAYLTKGTRVFVTGSLAVGEYTAKTGEVKQSIEIRVDDIELLGGGEKREEPAPRPPTGTASRGRPADDDIPFVSCAFDAHRFGGASV